jgi:hypothetical protein
MCRTLYVEMSKYVTRRQGIKSTTPVYSKYIRSTILISDINGGRGNINSTPLETGDKTVIQRTVMAHLTTSFPSLWVPLNADFLMAGTY